MKTFIAATLAALASAELGFTKIDIFNAKDAASCSALAAKIAAIPEATILQCATEAGCANPADTDTGEFLSTQLGNPEWACYQCDMLPALARIQQVILASPECADNKCPDEA